MVNVVREPWGYDGASKNILHSRLEVIVAKPSWYHLPKSNNMNHGREKTHIVIVLLATAFMTLCRFFYQKVTQFVQRCEIQKYFSKNS